MRKIRESILILVFSLFRFYCNPFLHVINKPLLSFPTTGTASKVLVTDIDPVMAEEKAHEIHNPNFIFASERDFNALR